MKCCRIKPVWSVFILVCVMTVSGRVAVQAEDTESNLSGKTVYVRPSSEIVIRRGKGTDYKIIALVKDGSPLELLEEDESYARVRLANGREGWVLSRFLSDEPPLDQLVVELREQNEQAAAREAATQLKLEELQAVLGRTREELSMATAERDSAVKDYENLREETADVIKIKTELKETSRQKEELSQQLTSLQRANEDLTKDRKLYWFLTGAGVLLLGMLLGRMPAPARRRKSSLL